MTLADHAGERELNERHRLWPFIESWAGELGLTGSDAINRVTQPGGRPATTPPPIGPARTRQAADWPTPSTRPPG